MVTPEGVRPAALVVADGVIARVADVGERIASRERFDAGNLVVMPGVVDTHVHVNEPGRTDWEGFAHATRAAAAGGVTTLVDMPLNAIPATVTTAALEAKRRAAAGQCHVDVGFWGGIVPGNGPDLAGLVAAGCLGFKAFLVNSGVSEFPAASYDDLASALPLLARLGSPLLVHAEDPTVVDRARAALGVVDPRDPAAWAAGRPPAAEEEAVDRLIELARCHSAHVHVVHVAAAGAVDRIGRAKRDGVRITAETCPHYLHFALADVPRGGTLFKCAPPIREAHHRERLWSGLADGTLDLIASDHSPAPPALKGVDAGRWDLAWGGIASLELALSVVWTGASARGHDLAQVARWMAARPAELAGLAPQKGRLAAGADADIVVLDPDARYIVDPAVLHHRHPLTPYAGRELAGVVRRTYVRGRLAFERGRPFGDPHGVLLSRTQPPGATRT